jgi:4a-hydroxytetrahydrobiopterin dehydratase
VTDAIAPQAFSTTDGLQDWRVLGDGVGTHFPTGSLTAGVRFVAALADQVDLDGHPPDLDVRPEGVTVRLATRTGDDFRLTRLDVDQALAVSAVARDLGLTADPTAVQTVQVSIDALDHASVIPFWRAVLGYLDRDRDGEDLADPLRRGAPFWFQQMDAPRTDRNRIHVDVFVPPEVAAARIDAAIDAGGRVITDAHAPSWWVLADPEGNEVCVATIDGRS